MAATGSHCPMVDFGLSGVELFEFCYQKSSYNITVLCLQVHKLISLHVYRKRTRVVTATYTNMHNILYMQTQTVERIFMSDSFYS
jgi:hypothetical protein